MGREVRRVPENWEHPKDDAGSYIPLIGASFSDDIEEWKEGRKKYKPVERRYMPDWPEEERTHYQMYETCTEGTPISPTMAGSKELAQWLADTGASAFAFTTATYEQWLATVNRGGAVSAVISSGRGLESGVVAAAREESK